MPPIDTQGQRDLLILGLLPPPPHAATPRPTQHTEPFTGIYLPAVPSGPAGGGGGGEMMDDLAGTTTLSTHRENGPFEVYQGRLNSDF